MKGEICICPATWRKIKKYLPKGLIKQITGQVKRKVTKRITKRVTKRRFSPAQLRAQRLFTKRAKNGTLKRMRRRR
jgi:hypothetical protein